MNLLHNHQQQGLAQNSQLQYLQHSHYINKFHRPQLQLDHSYLHKGLYIHQDSQYIDHHQHYPLNLDLYK